MPWKLVDLRRTRSRQNIREETAETLKYDVDITRLKDVPLWQIESSTADGITGPMKCQSCNRIFMYNVDRDRHYKCDCVKSPIVNKFTIPNTHYKCAFCDYDSHYRYNIKEHCEIIHSLLVPKCVDFVTRQEVSLTDVRVSSK